MDSGTPRLPSGAPTPAPAAPTWQDALRDRIAPELAREIDIFETQIELRRQGKLDEKVFAETRLRRGCYGQRYDNGQRHDGLESRTLPYPSGELTKGPSTLWDAPGMQRIKVPFGRVTAAQLEALAAVAEEHADGVVHVTTRQDFQLHFVHIEDTPTVMRRLAAAGLTTREACGNTVRNVTACPYAGVCSDETFDVSPYARALSGFLLGHPDAQDFGRKFKIAFSGCRQHACSLTFIHDLGAIAAVRTGPDGERRRGFAVYVGGGLGSVPYQAALLEEFLPEEELLPLAQAVCRVFARLGEKKNRQRARLKFLVARLGLEELRRLVLEERGLLAPDPRWTAYLDGIPGRDRPDNHLGDDGATLLDRPLRPAAPLGPGPHPPGFLTWHATNVRPQRQPGYVTATVLLPLGDASSDQLRSLAAIARRFTGDTLRTTVEQNLVLRWVSEADLPALFVALQQIGLAGGGAGTITDIVACPGTDTCKLGISSSRGLAAELGARIEQSPVLLDPSVRGLHIKASGCFNACGQHHIADIGLLGVSRNVGGRRVPHFQVVLGGQWHENGAAYGLAIGAVPSKRIPEAVERITGRYTRERRPEESFQAFIQRTGKAAVRELLGDLLQVPGHAEDPSFYSDWGDPREYTIGDMGMGECAGEVVSAAQFGLADAERQAFEAQLHLEKGEARAAAEVAYRAMLTAARALVREQLPDLPDEPERIVAEFRARLHETKLFTDPYAGDKFAQYFLSAHARATATAIDGNPVTLEAAHRRVEETQLFIEAAHACYDRLSQARAAMAGSGI